MIGLGSNRLSVCRRGGMSVTQAGKGGLEWLVGNGLRERTPYSAQATAALKDAFTAAQWLTIRDYGFAHPALVPFINEDPMLVMSLIEGLGYRLLVGDGTAYLVTGVNATSDVDIKWEAKQSSSDGVMLSGGIAWANKNIQMLVQPSVAQFAWANDYRQFNQTGWHDVYATWELKNGVYSRNGSAVASMSGTFSSDNKVALNCAYRSGIATGISDCDWRYIEFRGIGKYVPCKHKVDGVLEAGMLDLTNLIWYGNANIVDGVKQGSFTISESPS